MTRWRQRLNQVEMSDNRCKVCGVRIQTQWVGDRMFLSKKNVFINSARSIKFPMHEHCKFVYVKEVQLCT